MRQITRVQFPRFQYETKPEQDFQDRELIERAALRPMVSAHVVNQLIQPSYIVNSEMKDEKRETNWYGAYHTARYDQVVGDVFRPLWGKDIGKQRLFRLWHIIHDYQWDHQALSGRSHEVVLDKLKFDGDEPFEEVAALLINDRDHTRQKMVLREENGDWNEPVLETLNYRCNFSLKIMTELATSSLSDLVPAPDN